MVAVVGGWLISTAVRRLPSRAAQEREAAIVRWTPLLASLLAEMVHAGLPADVACARLSLSGDHPLAPQLAEVARRRALGADPATSVAPLLEQQATRRLGLALSRSLGDGASPVDALHALTADATAQRRAAAERECRRLASAAALPLGLTMLPAFMLVAVVPLVLAGIGPLLT